MAGSLEELKKAVEDAEKAKKVVLQLLRLNGIIAFDQVLDPEWEKLKKGEG